MLECTSPEAVLPLVLQLLVPGTLLDESRGTTDCLVLNVSSEEQIILCRYTFEKFRVQIHFFGTQRKDRVYPTKLLYTGRSKATPATSASPRCLERYMADQRTRARQG